MDDLGTLQAQHGAVERVLNPHLWDAVFPVIAFVLVIVIPASIALWAIIKTIRERDVSDGEV
jgi:hypothetical protein